MATLLLTLMLTRPRVGLVATFVYLMLLGFLRRLLIGPAGWSSADPMLLVGPLMGWVGYVPGAVQLTPAAAENLRALFSIAPAAIYFLSAIVFSRYPITRDAHRQMRERLAARAGEPAATTSAAS